MRCTARVASASFAGLALLAAAPGSAELLKCQGPDGRVLYTDKAQRCPGAEPFQPAVEIQQTTSPAPAAAPAPAGQPSRRDLAADAERAMAQRWARKKRAAEDAIERIRARREQLREFVAHCNRGGFVLTRDEAGIKHTVSCDAIRGEFAALDAQEAEVRSYLAKGLPDECRRAGCLPGWIR